MAKMIQRLWLAVCLLVLSGIVTAQLATVQIPEVVAGQAATQLADGRWLLSGGALVRGKASEQLFIATTASAKPNLLPITLKRARLGHTATLMPDGRVLVIGGIDAQGLTVNDAEIVEPAAGISTIVGSLGLIPRAYHSATLLPDSRILITGGVDGKGHILRDAELLNTDDLQIERFNARSEIARWQHMGQLLPSQAVLLLGGVGDDGKPVNVGELYDLVTQRFGPELPTAIQQFNALPGGQAPVVVGSLPSNGTTDVTAPTRIVVRFSQWMAPGTFNSQSVRLLLAGQSVSVNIVAAERGLLLFVTPRQPLKAAGDYQLVIGGAQDALNRSLPKTVISFRTAADAVLSGQTLAADVSISQAVATPIGSSTVENLVKTPSPIDSVSKGDTTTELRSEGIDGALRNFSLPLIFEMNRGQHDGKIKFSTFGRGYRLHLAQTETMLDMETVEPTKKNAAKFAAKDLRAQREMLRAWLAKRADKRAQRQQNSVQDQDEEFEMKPHRVRMHLVGANPAPNVVGMEPLASKTHYIDAQHPERNLKDVPHYGKVLHTNVYPGIDKLYYGKEGKLEYDWIVKPGAKPGLIAQRIEGVDSVVIDPAGDAVLTINGNSIKQKKPVAYQTINDETVSVNVEYVLRGKTLRFQIGTYNESLPLTIDPVIVYSTYFGGAGKNIPTQLRVANDGSVFLLVDTQGSPLAATNTVSIPCPLCNYAPYSYLAKFRPDNSELEYLTQFVNSIFRSLIVTESSAGPQALLLSTSGAVAKLKAAGDAYEFFRNPGVGGVDFAVDSAGSIYIANAVPNPALSPVYYAGVASDPSGGLGVAKLSADASRVLFQFLYRSSPGIGLYNVYVDNAGSPYLVGYSFGLLTATINPQITGMVSRNRSDNYSDKTFILKLNPTGDSIQYANYLFYQDGTSNYAYSASPEIAFDTQNNMYVRGIYESFRQMSLNKYAPNGAIIYSTKFDPLLSPAVPYCDACKASLTMTPNAEVYTATEFIDQSNNTGRYSTAVNKFSASGSLVGAPFYIQSANSSIASSFIRWSGNGTVYLAGRTNALDFPLINPIQPNLPATIYSPDSIFLAKLAYDSLFVSSPNPSQFGQPVTLTLANLGTGVSGSVSFFDGATFLGAAPVDANGNASLTISNLAVGTHLLAGQLGSNRYTTTQLVQQNTFQTLTTLTAASGSLGTTLLQVRVTASGSPFIPSGTVTLMEGPVQRGEIILDSTGAASFSLVCLTGGAHTYVARYKGDGNHAASDSVSTTYSAIEAPINIALTYPPNGATIAAPDNILLAANATPVCPTTTVSKVSFQVNGVNLADAVQVPYNAIWPATGVATYALSAIATSGTGKTYVSPTVTVQTVNASAGTTTYLHQDLTGNTIAATDVNGNLLYTESYRPYGERLENTAQSQATQPVGNRIWFHGKVQDEATGLQYFGARYYDPVIGRFMGVDPAGFDEGNIHSVNRFAYGNNNPYRYRDPDGRAALTLFEFGLITAGAIIVANNTLTPQQKRQLLKGFSDLFGGSITHNETANSNDSGGTNGDAGEKAKPRKDGEGSTPEEIRNSAGGPTAGKPVSSGERQKILDRDRNSDGSYTCWRCGEKTDDESRVQIGHKNVPRSKDGNKHPDNLGCEGANCNRSAGNRGEVKEGGDCKSKGGC